MSFFVVGIWKSQEKEFTSKTIRTTHTWEKNGAQEI